MEINWWHSFDFEEFQTQGKDDSPNKLQFIQIPENLEGMSVLDIGAWDGYFSFVAERRGAKRVLAVDTRVWNEKLLWDPQLNKFMPNLFGKEGFETARKALNSKVEDKEIEIADLNINSVGTFDLVLCLGILYHMKDPFQIIRNLYEITNKQLIIETFTDGNYLAVPAMIFYPEREINNDPDTWWGPNIFCLIDMLKVAGFKKVNVVGIAGNRVAIHAFK